MMKVPYLSIDLIHLVAYNVPLLIDTDFLA